MSLKGRQQAITKALSITFTLQWRTKVPVTRCIAPHNIIILRERWRKLMQLDEMVAKNVAWTYRHRPCFACRFYCELKRFVIIHFNCFNGLISLPFDNWCFKLVCGIGMITTRTLWSFCLSYRQKNYIAYYLLAKESGYFHDCSVCVLLLFVRRSFS